jgi:dynein heavy chain
LLSRLIAKEQRTLEEQLDALNKSVVMNKATLQELEEQLLDKLASVEGSLLDDPDILDVLSNIKNKSKDVSEKLQEAAEKTADINEKRELFRPVAARGAVLYFCIVEMANVEWMYNTSLPQFLDLFYLSIEQSEKAQIIKDRVHNITEELTMRTYRYIDRGLFEKHKTTFKLMVSTRIMTKDRRLTNNDVALFLKSG